MVYVTSEQKNKNLIPALSYGNIKILLSQDNQADFSTEFVIPELKSKLSEFNDNDYLLLIGDPVIIALTAMIAGKINGGKVKFLKWDRQEKIYIPISANID